MSETRDIKPILPKPPHYEVLDIISSPEPSVSELADRETVIIPSNARELIAKVCPCALGCCRSFTVLCQYTDIPKPLSPACIADLLADAIKLRPEEQDVITEELRSILVFQNVVKVDPRRELGPSGKVSGNYIADWDIVPVPFENAVCTSICQYSLALISTLVPKLRQEKHSLSVRAPRTLG